jgi:hypothetical protein
LRLSKDLVNQESGNALRAPRFDGSDKPRGASRKLTHANDFMALSALLRNFYRPSARDREALLGVGRRPSRQPAAQPIAHFASTLDKGKTAKNERNVSS